MADLFSLTAPLLIRFPDGRAEVMAEYFEHPAGLVYLRTFWNRYAPAQAVQLVAGELRGEGPWKVGDAVITVLGCHGSHPEQAAEFAEWQAYREQLGDDYPDREALRGMVRSAGYLP